MPTASRGGALSAFRSSAHIIDVGHLRENRADFRIIRPFEPAHELQRLGDVLERLLRVTAQPLELA